MTGQCACAVIRVHLRTINNAINNSCFYIFPFRLPQLTTREIISQF